MYMYIHMRRCTVYRVPSTWCLPSCYEEVQCLIQVEVIMSKNIQE